MFSTILGRIFESWTRRTVTCQSCPSQRAECMPSTTLPVVPTIAVEAYSNFLFSFLVLFFTLTSDGIMTRSVCAGYSETILVGAN